jgi:hypothetical protein
VRVVEIAAFYRGNPADREYAYGLFGRYKIAHKKTPPICQMSKGGVFDSQHKNQLLALDSILIA